METLELAAKLDGLLDILDKLEELSDVPWTTAPEYLDVGQAAAWGSGVGFAVRAIRKYIDNTS